MKWGRKKAAAASSHPSLITHVFPSSWFSKFKQKRSNFEPMSAKAKQQVQQGSTSSCSLPYAPWQEGRFYCGDDDPDWRLSFGEEGAERSKVWLNSVWDAPNDNDREVSIPNSGSSNTETFSMFSDMASDVKKAREVKEKVRSSLGNEEIRREKVPMGAERKWACRTKVKDKKSRISRRTFRDKEEREDNTAKKATFELQPENIIHTREDFSKPRVSESRYRRSFSFPNSNLRTIQEDGILKTLNLETSNAFSKAEQEDEEEITLQCKRMEHMKINEMMLKTEQERGAVYMEHNSPRKKRKQTSRIKCSSPRTAAKIECKIRALEDMKKAKMRRKKTKETTLRDAAIFESYAVAKSSFNPQKDFRDSMIEMIMEKGIQAPEELEELLACYLTLNYDEYHDLIIKVFRQVYFELNQMYFSSELQNYLHCHDHKFL